MAARRLDLLGDLFPDAALTGENAEQPHNVRPAVIRAFLHGQLTPGRTQELHAQLLAAGLPV